MEIGTVVICRFDNSWNMHVGLVVDNTDEIIVSVNSRAVPLTQENLIGIVGITEESIIAAKEHGRWMV